MELQVLFEKKKKIGECKYNTKALKRSTDYCFFLVFGNVKKISLACICVT